jgi:acetate kinase
MRTSSVLVLNSGSSSIKFALFRLTRSPVLIRRGTIDPEGSPFSLDRHLGSLAADVDDHPLAAVAHRVVHGGSTHVAPALLTDALIADLERLVPLAPNHLPPSLALIAACRRERPDVPQIACFDTAFHAALPPESQRLPIPKPFHDQGVRRYGFHGLAFTFLMQELRRVSPERARGRIVLAHLGNGSSLAAVHDGRPVDTTMGFTPLGGVVMGTRTGDIDPGVLVHLMRTQGLDADGLERLISHESGLAGISGRTADVKELLAREADEPDCQLAVTVYCYEIRKRVGSYAAALGGLDVLVFSGGIGEHAPSIRGRVCGGLEFAGVKLDPALNAANAKVISTGDSPVVVRMIPANEELVMAEAAHTVLHARSD